MYKAQLEKDVDKIKNALDIICKGATRGCGKTLTRAYDVAGLEISLSIKQNYLTLLNWVLEEEEIKK